jgi:hypothetical protein
MGLSQILYQKKRHFFKLPPTLASNSVRQCLVFFFLSIRILSYSQDNVSKISLDLKIPAKASINIAGPDLKFNFVSDKTIKQHVFSSKSEGKLWINYSSVVERGTSNTIFVSFGAGNVPAEVFIHLKVGEDAGFGSGKTGEPLDPIILSDSPQPIIQNIGSCYTGVGEGKGHSIIYSWELDERYDPDLINLDELQLETEIIYTIVTQ